MSQTLAAERPRTYREMLTILRQYEGSRCLWRVAAGAVLIALVPILAIGGFVAGAYLADDLGDPVRVAVGAVVALGAGQLAAACIWRRRPWHNLIAGRLASYERLDPPGDLNAMIRRADFPLAARALRRARLNPWGATQVPAAVSGVPDLDLKLIVYRSALWHPAGTPELHVQIRDCLRAAGITANVAGEDLLP
ncbi:MAG: hypothetical protein ACLQBY_13135 [Solirubrobacteraceae bacterium]